MAKGNKIDKGFYLLKLIPITVLISLVSQTSILYYYRSFNFSPITYFDPYELIIVSSKDFFVTAIFVVLYHQLIQIYILPIFDRKRTQPTRNLAFREYIKYCVKASNIYMIIAIVISMLLIPLSYLEIELEGKLLIYIMLIWAIIILILIALDMRYSYLTKMKNQRSTEVKQTYILIDFRYFIVISVLFISSIFLASKKSQYIKKNNPYKGTVLITEEDEIIKCTSKVLFIGKSQKYYFIYNTPDSSMRIIAREKLKKEVIKLKSDINFIYRF